MNRFQTEYNAKKCTVSDALAGIHSNDIIVCGGSALEPRAILNEMHTIADSCENVTVFVAVGTTPYPFMVDPQYKASFRTHCNFKMGAGRQAHRLNLSDTVPADLHLGERYWAREHKPTVFISQATPMDENGYLRISIALLHEMEGLEQADRVILEVNPNVPVAEGDNLVHISQVDQIVEVDYGMPIVPKSQISEVERAIGENIAALVNDGDTIQLGIGSIPDAAAMSLMSKHDLGVHTEMITSSMRDLVQAGVITNRKKTLNNGKLVGSFVMGTQELYDWVDHNPDVLMLRGCYVNDPHIISQQENMISINNGLCADLGGQICSESIGSLHYSGSGGQFVTAYGAFLAPGGRNVIALRSVAHTKKGDVPAITAQLPLGSVVTLPRNYIDYIVTEYGAARLSGLTIRERVDALIAISHPDYRAELRHDADRLLLW